MSKCEVLKGRFKREAEDSLFPKGTADNIPMDGLPVFIDQTWSVIKDSKELNLPDQREMVANYRCNEIKQEALEKVADAI